MKLVATFIALACSLCLFLSCTARGEPAFFPHTEGLSTPQKASIGSPRRHHQGYRVLLVAGPQYIALTGIDEELTKEFGAESGGGMYSRVERLRDLSYLPDRSIILTIGAPEGTVRDIVRLHDTFPTLRVATLMPQEDSLAVEEISDLVVNITQSDEPLAQEGSEQLLEPGELSLLLLASALYLEQEGATGLAETRMPQVLDIVRKRVKQKDAGKNWHFTAWRDPENSLKSKNHLIFVPAGGQGEP
ncbi:MAG: hypothetical protein JW875_08905 [Spirochaetales bacterium]|nr:hypothetical protein [Spirochaetales bacterium]